MNATTPTGSPAVGTAEVTRALPESPASPEPEAARPWDRLVRRHGRLLRRMAYDVLRALGQRPDEGDIDDMVQEVFCRLLERGAAFDPTGEDLRRERAYLRRVTRSVAVDRRRAARAEKRGGGVRWVSAGPVDLHDDEEGAVPLPDPAPGPEQQLISRERWRLFLRRCRGAAGRAANAGRDAQAVALALVGGWTSAELAAASREELSPATIDSLVCRLRRRLAAGGLTLPRRGGVSRRGSRPAVRRSSSGG